MSPVTTRDALRAIALLTLSLLLPLTATAWEVPKATEPPVIDGIPDDDAWTGASCYTGIATRRRKP